VPDPAPNGSQNEPQPDAYQSVPATVSGSPATQPQPQLLPSAPVTRPKTTERSAPTRVQPSGVASPVQAAVAATEAPVARSAPSRTEAHIVMPTVVRTASVTHTKRSRAAHATGSRAAHAAVHRQRHAVAHRAHAATQQTPISFARSALDLRWPAAFAPSPTVEVARPRQVSPSAAVAVAAVVLLSGSFLAVAARQVRQQVGP
jgi:hypothetical protein